MAMAEIQQEKAFLGATCIQALCTTEGHTDAIVTRDRRYEVLTYLPNEMVAVHELSGSNWESKNQPRSFRTAQTSKSNFPIPDFCLNLAHLPMYAWTRTSCRWCPFELLLIVGIRVGNSPCRKLLLWGVPCSWRVILQGLQLFLLLQSLFRSSWVGEKWRIVVLTHFSPEEHTINSQQQTKLHTRCSFSARPCAWHQSTVRFFLGRTERPSARRSSHR